MLWISRKTSINRIEIVVRRDRGINIIYDSKKWVRTGPPHLHTRPGKLRQPPTANRHPATAIHQPPSIAIISNQVIWSDNPERTREPDQRITHGTRKRVIKVSANLVITNAETRPPPPPRSLCTHSRGISRQQNH